MTMFYLRLCILFISLSFSLVAQDNYVHCRKIEQVQRKMKEVHIEPISIEANERKEICQNYVDKLDESNLFFSREDVIKIQCIAENEGLCEAFLQSVNMYEKSLKEYDSISVFFFKSPITLKKGNQYRFNRFHSGHLRPNQQVKKSFIEKELCYVYLTNLAEYMEKDSLSLKQVTSEIEKKIREKTSKQNKQYVNKKLKSKELLYTLTLEVFLNALTEQFDPHSAYFSLQQKNEFEKQLSAENEMFGFQFEEDDDFKLKISAIVPGSSAWKSAKIKVGDEIVSIRIPKKEWINPDENTIEELYTLLANHKIIEVRIQHENGNVEEVLLIKTKVENKENTFQSYILKGTHDIGYIALPSFYTDFESENQLGCANDVAKEIILLKKDSIKGLILDLRNNGGGSLKEAIELCGLFIDEGAMAIYQGKSEKPYLLKDMNRGTVYNGPLIVLVNSMSASASEFFAGCMQDYNRALIVGDTTYGKGTAQSVFPINEEQENTDFVKATNGRFYFVSSRSNQAIGVIPDVLLEDLYAQIDVYKESKQAHALVNDSTAKKTLYKALQYNWIAYAKHQQKRNQATHLNGLKKRASQLSDKIKKD